MSLKNYIAAAQDITKKDTITLALTWADGDSVSIERNNKKITITAGSTITTPALMAAALVETLMANHHNTASFTAGQSANAGGREYGEFWDITADAVGAIVTLSSAVAGTDFTVTVTSITAGDGTATHVANVVAATGREWIDNADNYSDGILPVADDTVFVRQSGISLKYALTSLPDSVNWKFIDNFNGNVGLPAINTTTSAYPYSEDRQRFLNTKPASGGDQSVTVRGSTTSAYYLDYGSNSPLTFAFVKVSQGNVFIQGGKSIVIDATGGVTRIGDNQTSTVSDIYSVEVNDGASVNIGENCTLHNTDDSLVVRGSNSLVEVSCAHGGTTSMYRIYNGILRVMETATAYGLRAYGGKIDWRGVSFDNLHVYSEAEFDANLCEECTATDAIELFKGATYRDRANVVSQDLDFNGCTPSEITLQLRPNLRMGLSVAPGGVGV